MDVLLRIDINLIAAAVLFVIILISFKKLDRTDVLNRLYMHASIVVFIGLLLEALSCIINHQESELYQVTSIIIHVLLYASSPVLAYIWLLFNYRWFRKSEKIKKSLFILMAIPLIFNTILVLLSSFLPLVFSIGEGNTYQRESLFWVPFAIANGYLLLSTLFVLVNRRKILREEFIPLVLFALFPVIGSLVQGLLYGVLLMWSATAFSLTLVFTFLQGRMRQIDGLTKTWFRSSFDNFIDEILRGNPQATFGLICFDLDNLKIINDRFGHLEGDFALEKACEIVRKVTDNRHVIARRGGDEFFMYVDTDQVDQLYTIVELIHKDLESFNQTSHKLFPLHCSFGYGIFQGEKQTYKSFLRKIDEEMYLNKNRKISYKPHN